MKKKIIAIFLLALMITFIPLGVKAHPGRTDSKGGHYNRSTGEYHYHHGYSAHDHYDMDGDGDVDCPYNFDDKTDHSSSSGNNRGNSDAFKHREVPTFDFEDLTVPTFDYDTDFEKPTYSQSYVNQPKESAPENDSDEVHPIAFVVIYISMILLPFIVKKFLDKKIGGS